MRRVGATTSSSRRSRGFEVSPSSAPAPVAQQSLVAQRTSSIALARLRDLALLPALAVLLVIGSIISPVFLTSGNINTILTSSAALALVVLAESLVIITGKFDLSLEFDLRHRARDRRHGGPACRGFRLRIRMADRDRHSHRSGRRRPGRLHQRLHGGEAEAQRLHRDAGDADHPARHAGRRDARADLVRPARRLLRPDGDHLPRPAARGVARGRSPS